MGADLGVPLSDLRLLCVSVAGGESRKTFTQFSKRENVKTCANKTTHRPKTMGPTLTSIFLVCCVVLGCADSPGDAEVVGKHWPGAPCPA